MNCVPHPPLLTPNSSLLTNKSFPFPWYSSAITAGGCPGGEKPPKCSNLPDRNRIFVIFSLQRKNDEESSVGVQDFDWQMRCASVCYLGDWLLGSSDWEGWEYNDGVIAVSSLLLAASRLVARSQELAAVTLAVSLKLLVTSHQKKSKLSTSKCLAEK